MRGSLTVTRRGWLAGSMIFPMRDIPEWCVAAGPDALDLSMPCITTMIFPPSRGHMTGLSPGTTVLSRETGRNARSRFQVRPLSSLTNNVQKESRSFLLNTWEPSVRPSAPSANRIRPEGRTSRSGIFPCTVVFRMALQVRPWSFEKPLMNVLLGPKPDPNSPSWR